MKLEDSAGQDQDAQDDVEAVLTHTGQQHQLSQTPYGVCPKVWQQQQQDA